MNPCLIGKPKEDNYWHKKHEEFKEKSKTCDVDVIWIGDSIIEQIQSSTLWNQKISKLKCINYGIGGDRVENLLWRIDNGELDFNYKVKVVVLHVGTNNISQTAEEISEGIINLVETITKKMGDVVILFPSLLPKGQHPNKGRETNKKVNQLLENSFSESKYNGKVIIISIDNDIIEKNSTISKKMLHDYLHLTDEAYTKHNRYVTEAKTSESEIVWIGDSITEGLRNSTLWKTKISLLHCANFGIGGDRVEHLLWRIENGELDFSSNIKIIVLLIGTNNTNVNAADIFEGIVNLVDKISSKQPNAALILLTLLPRGQFPNKVREKNFEVNNFLIEKYKNKDEENKNIHLIPIHENIVQEDGTISHHVFHDYLHLTDYAYTKIFTPVYEKIVELLNEKKT